MSHSPHPSLDLVIVAGPNGAGKSTMAEALLRGDLSVEEFVNADVIARGLSAFSPGAAALAAGRILLTRIRELARQRVSFAFETTLASRTIAPWIRTLEPIGYQVHIVYFWLPSPELAVQRVRHRVLSGGHDVPEGTIRRRYQRSLSNFFTLYRPLAHTWHVYDNASSSGPCLIARGRRGSADEVVDASTWRATEAPGHGG
ncbi:MAG TPA: AAA family ATPase [Planctomycetota bacterium]